MADVLVRDAHLLTPAEVAAARDRRLQARALQRIEGNPLDAGQMEMFEMFEREAWSHERRLEYLMERVRTRPYSNHKS